MSEHQAQRLAAMLTEKQKRELRLLVNILDKTGNEKGGP